MTEPKFPPKLIDDGMVTYISIQEHEALIRETEEKVIEGLTFHGKGECKSCELGRINLYSIVDECTKCRGKDD